MSSSLRKILVVDSDVEDRKAAVEALRAAGFGEPEGFQVVEREEIEGTTLVLAADHGFVAVITAWKSRNPKTGAYSLVDGLRLLEQLRTHLVLRLRALPVIINSHDPTLGKRIALPLARGVWKGRTPDDLPVALRELLAEAP